MSDFIPSHFKVKPLSPKKWGSRHGSGSSSRQPPATSSHSVSGGTDWRLGQAPGLWVAVISRDSALRGRDRPGRTCRGPPAENQCGNLSSEPEEEQASEGQSNLIKEARDPRETDISQKAELKRVQKERGESRWSKELLRQNLLLFH